MSKWLLSESGGRFIASSIGGCVTFDGDGDLGRGTSPQQVMFATNQERAFFIQIDEMKQDLAGLHSQLGYVRTVRGANQNLREVRAERRAARYKLKS